MAHFYGRVRGRGKSEATRCGSKGTGLQMEAMAWGGSVMVRLYHLDGVDYVSVLAGPHPDKRRPGTTRTLYCGPVAGLALEPGKFSENAPSLATVEG